MGGTGAWSHYIWDSTLKSDGVTDDRGSCQKCHTATVFSNFANNPTTYDATRNDFSHLMGWNQKAPTGAATGGSKKPERSPGRQVKFDTAPPNTTKTDTVRVEPKENQTVHAPITASSDAAQEQRQTVDIKTENDLPPSDERKQTPFVLDPPLRTSAEFMGTTYEQAGLPDQLARLASWKCRT